MEQGSLSYVLIHVPWSKRVPALYQPLQFPASGCPPPPWDRAWPAASRPGRRPCFGPRTASHPPAPRRPSLGPYLSPELRPGRAGPPARAAWRRPRVPGPLELRDSPEQIFAVGRGARQGWGHPAAGTRGKGRGRGQGRAGAGRRRRGGARRARGHPGAGTCGAGRSLSDGAGSGGAEVTPRRTREGRGWGLRTGDGPGAAGTGPAPVRRGP